MPRIAAIQMQSVADVQENLDKAAGFIAEAAAQGADLVALPEMFATIALPPADKHLHKESDNGGPLQTFLSAQAKQHGAWLVGGSIPMAHKKNATRFTNSALVFDAQGQRVARYDKIHLFDAEFGHEKHQCYRESSSTLHGDKPVVLETPFGKIGLAICYDLRFSALFQAYQRAEVDMVIMPTAFVKHTGKAHWEVLVRARAIENQCYMIAPNEIGDLDNGMQTYGQTMIVDPWGKIIVELMHGEGVVMTDIDLDLIRQTREKLPLMQHQRL